MPRKGPISGRTLYTVEEQLARDPIKGKLAREIADLERQFEKEQQKQEGRIGPKQKVKPLINKLLKIEGITTYFNKYEHVIKYKDTAFCWISNRKYGVGVTIWDKGGENTRTTRVETKEHMKETIEMLKKRIKEVKKW